MHSQCGVVLLCHSESDPDNTMYQNTATSVRKHVKSLVYTVSSSFSALAMCNIKSGEVSITKNISPHKGFSFLYKYL